MLSISAMKLISKPRVTMKHHSIVRELSKIGTLEKVKDRNDLYRIYKGENFVEWRHDDLYPTLEIDCLRCSSQKRDDSFDWNNDGYPGDYFWTIKNAANWLKQERS